MEVEKKIEKFNIDFEAGKEIFKDYCNTVAYIIKSLLNKNSFEYQIVTNRVKTIQSIENKVVKGFIPENINELTEIDDIIGCRVIFYLESDIEKFVSLLYGEFTVKKNNLRYSENGYNASHLVVELEPKRLELMEYEKFSGLKCEIQLTTVLFHSWSEISHNIIYKMPEGLTEFDERSVKALKKEFEEVMKNHIKPASYTFEFINERFKNLKEGKKIFDLDFLQSIMHSNLRNELYENLRLLHQFIIEFGDKTPDDFNLIEIIPGVIDKSKIINKTEDTTTTSGKRYDYEHHHVVGVCLDILNEIRYYNIEQTLEILMDLANDEEKKIRDKSIEVLNNLSKYNLKVIEKIGYVPQLKMINKINNTTLEVKIRLFDFLEKLFLNLLNFEFHDYSLIEYNKIGIQSGEIGVNEHLIKVRKQVITQLKELFESSRTEKVRLSCLKVLMEATKLPRKGNFDEDIEVLVLNNIDDIFDWLSQQYENYKLKEIKVLDGNINRLIKQYPSMNNIEKLITLESLIKGNRDYDVFKTLVGYDLSYGRELGWREVREQRNNKTFEYFEDIYLDNYSTWEVIILSIAECYSSTEEGEFLNFRKFLFDLGKIKSDFAKELISKNEEKLGSFLSNIIAGIMSANFEDDFGEQLILGWLKDKKYIVQSANVFILIENINVELLKKIFECAKETNNIDAIYNIFLAILNKNEFYQQLSNLFIETIEVLSNHKQFYWTHHIWFEENSILKFLNSSQFDTILCCLENFDSIDVHEQELLKPICIEYPEKIVSFFERRLQVKIQKQSKGYNRLIDSYDVVPYNFYDMDKLLKEKSEIILPLLMGWLDKSEWWFQREATHLIKNIFPEFDEPLQNYLNDLIDNGQIEDAKKVLRIIKEFNGSPKTYELSKNLIKKYGGNQELMKGLISALTQTGVVTGIYGFVDAYRSIKKEIKQWQKLKNSEINKFVSEFTSYINRLIIHETRRADSDKEMMKRRYSGN
ncbi:RelA/SpoT domain-containing protein [Peribacillus psychrosaccharolyticus]|uniref:hypothetical protein n=1 Tax=Peribacillus psychrosaccharolyticus TaxID=1407 RepID=UPI003D26E986